MTAKRFRVNDLVKYNYSEIGEYIDENHTDRPLRNDELVELLNELHEEKEQLLSDKEHLMGCLIRFFGYDDEDIDYNLNRKSNREYGKAYYSMKEETEKEL